MSKQQRLTLHITLFNQNRRADVLATLTVGELIQEILVAFGTQMRFLDQHQPDRYQLSLPESAEPLAETVALAQCVANEDQLIFAERSVLIPSGAQPLETPFYLRYRSHVFPVTWQPAIIGRPEPGAEQNDWLAINLESCSHAVSRQHAEIVAKDGRWFVRQLAANPVLLNGVPLPFNEQDNSRSPLVPFDLGATIHLTRSGISLFCLAKT